MLKKEVGSRHTPDYECRQRDLNAEVWFRQIAFFLVGIAIGWTSLAMVAGR